VALLPALTSTLLHMSATSFAALLLPVLQGLAASASWTVRRSTAGVLPVVLAALVGGAHAGMGRSEADEGGSETCEQCSEERGGEEGNREVQQEKEVVRSAPGVRDKVQGAREPRSVRVAGSVTEAACALLQEVQAKHAVAGKQVQAIAKEQFLVGRGWRGRSQLEQGHSEYHERKQLVGQKRTDQQQQQEQQQQELQQACEPIIRLLVTELGVRDVSHWVRSAAVFAAGPALCALPRCVRGEFPGSPS